MDLPTYTNIWRIEKRLYKLYDLRLPMPLPLVQIGVFVGVFLPWIVLLQVAGLPFHAPWHVVYLVPPGVLTWLATRPVIEGKRLTELLISQVRYLTEARTWARLTPIHEPGEVAVVGRVWRRGHLSGQRVHAAHPAPERVERAPALAATATPAVAAPPIPERAGAGHAAHGAARRPAAQRPPAPSLQPTPHDGTAAVPPAGGRRLTPPRVEPTRPQPVRSEPTARPTPIRPPRPQPTAPQPVRGLPAAGTPATPVTPGTPTTPGTPARPGSPARPGLPAAPAAHATGPASAEPDSADRRATERGRPAEGGPEIAPQGPGREADVPRRVTRQRSASHEPEASAATTRPTPTLPPAPTGPSSDTPAAKPAGPATPARPEAPARLDALAPPDAPARPDTPATPNTPTRADTAAKPDESPGFGRHAAPPRPPAAHPGASPTTASDDAGTPRPTGATPARPPAAGRSDRPAETGEPGRPARPGRPAAPEQADQGGLPAQVIPLPHGRHAKPADDPAAHGSAEPPTGTDGPARPGGGRPAEPPADHGAAALSDEEQAIAEARTDQIVWPTPSRRNRAPRPDAGNAAPPPADADTTTPPRVGSAPPRPEEGTPQPRPDTGPAQPRVDAGAASAQPEKDTARPRADTGTTPPRDASPGRPGRLAAAPRGRSHGEEATPSREARPPAARETSTPAPGWTPPAPGVLPSRPATPPAPPRAPAAGPASPPAASPRPTSPQAPAQPPRTPPARPAQVPAARPARPTTPPRQGADQQAWPARPDAAAASPESPPRAVRSGPASPVRPGPMPQTGHEDEARDDGRGRRRIFSGGGSGDGDYEQRVRTAFAGARRVVVLGCTGGAGQTVTGLMLGHTFAQHRGDRIVAVDVNPGPGAMARRTKTETRETLTSLITHAEQVTGYQMMRRYTSISKSGLEVVAAGKNPVQALDDRDYALAMRTLDRFYSITLLDAAAAVVARVLPYADQIVLVAPASSDAPRAVAMTFEWLDGHGYEDLRSRAVTVINGVSRRSMDDVEQAEAVARGRCRALVRIPWDDHLSLDRAPRNELRSLRAPTRKAYIALGGVVAGGLVQTPGRYPQQEVSR
ncbi:TcpE family conjugal transfer membrane protein [Actinoallomurus sp. NPDC050550]|uniref:TcpE family conjugal transfer membrane protein n=1 Tax=Actinoallomurus sp. NPDC050550 TaxID=3154937 RepID=UPI0033FEFCE9